MLAVLTFLTVYSFLVLGGDHSLVLKEIPVPLWPHKECEAALRSSFGARFTLPPTAVCAGAEGRDACDVSVETRKVCPLTALIDALGKK